MKGLLVVVGWLENGGGFILGGCYWYSCWKWIWIGFVGLVLLFYLKKYKLVISW